jgi:hypothetical protein
VAAPQHFLYFLPLPQGQGSFLLALFMSHSFVDVGSKVRITRHIVHHRQMLRCARDFVHRLGMMNRKRLVAEEVNLPVVKEPLLLSTSSTHRVDDVDIWIAAHYEGGRAGKRRFVS